MESHLTLLLLTSGFIGLGFVLNRFFPETMEMLWFVFSDD